MKGVVFNILEEMVIEGYGMDAWNDILDQAQQSTGIFIAFESYPDEQLFELVGIICEKLNQPAEIIVRAFGEFLFSKLSERYHNFIEDHDNLDSFLKSIHSVIHVEVAKLYVDPNLPTIECFDNPDGTMTLRYRSPRKLCILAEGLIYGAAKEYKQDISLTHDVCMHKGSEFCDIVVSYK
ncbi:hypothetical protein CBF23_006335 [Marinomonas agarivorans]|nr:hypothetical protein CBF23_006335 [Marinomonas agarivorans]